MHDQISAADVINRLVAMLFSVWSKFAYFCPSSIFGYFAVIVLVAFNAISSI